MGSNPPTFKKRHPCDYRKSEDFFCGVGGGRGERVEARRASCVKLC